MCQVGLPLPDPISVEWYEFVRSIRSLCGERLRFDKTAQLFDSKVSNKKVIRGSVIFSWVLVALRIGWPFQKSR